MHDNFGVESIARVFNLMFWGNIRKSITKVAKAGHPKGLSDLHIKYTDLKC